MGGFDLTDLVEKYKYKAPIALGLVGLVLIGGGLFLSSSKGVLPAGGRQEFPKESLVEKQKITVDVSGAVTNPGVYQLGNDSRVEDAIKSAGGLSDGATGRGKANAEYVSKSLNMAQKLSDGMKIYVPFQGEQTGGVIGASGVVGASTHTGKVNLNTGTQADLEALPGIGPVTAGKIISGRPYQKVDDLLSQKIISKAVFDKIKDLLVIY